MKRALLVAVGLVLASDVRSAAAQTVRDWTDWGYFNLNAGFEFASSTLNDAVTFRVYDEDGSLSVTQPVDSGGFIDVGVGARVWRNVSAGLAIHKDTTHTDAAAQGSIPHPLVFNRPRAVATGVDELSRTERAVHLQFGYMLPVMDRLSVHVTLGPSFFKLRQDVIETVSVQETGGNFNTVNATPATTRRDDSSVGFNIGADVTYLVYTAGQARVGAGAFLRWARATAEIQVLDDGQTVESKVGGPQIGFGARIRF